MAAQRSTKPRLRVLFADDNPDQVLALKLLLDSAGIDAVGVSSGESALEQFRKCEPQVVLLDIGMPGLNGHEVARAMRAARPDVLMVAITAYGTQIDKMLSRSAGFDHHLTKPADPHALIALLEHHGATLRAASGNGSCPSWGAGRGAGRPAK